MSRFFKKENGQPLTRNNYTGLSLRLACEAHDCPVFGPYDGSTFELPDNLSATELDILKDLGYGEVKKPETPSSPPDWAEELLREQQGLAGHSYKTFMAEQHQKKSAPINEDDELLEGTVPALTD